MKTRPWLSLVTALALLGSAPFVLAEDIRPDNSGANARDRGGNTITPIDQADSAEDLRITQTIRKAVVADDALSLNAQNVKIITQNGVVTLRGPVRSVAERASIAAKATGVAGVTRVDNQLEIASP
ncbi:MAG: BON domain-containing protein [bacterium]